LTLLPSAYSCSHSGMLILLTLDDAQECWAQSTHTEPRAYIAEQD